MKKIMRFSDRLLCLILSLTLACSENSEQQKEHPKQELPDKIVFIFEECPENKRYTFGNGTWTHNEGYEIRYIDDLGILRFFNPTPEKDADTLVVETTRDILEIQHAYKGLDNLSFLFQKEDSVLFTYDGRKPNARVLNRNADPLEINYDVIKRERIIKDDFPGLIRENPIFALTDSNISHLSYDERFTLNAKMGKENALQEYEEEKLWLYSLKKQNALSKQAYEFYHFKSLYDINTLLFPTPRFSKAPNLRMDYQLPIEGTVSETILQELLHPKNDSLLVYSFYQNLLDRILHNHFVPKAELIQQSNGSHWDFRQVYDSVQHATWLSEKAKKILLNKTFAKIVETASVNDIQKYRDRFIQEVGDTAYLNYIDTKYRLNEGVSGELLVKNLSGKSTSLASILEKHQGKLVYADFWASWCAPCIRAMPSSKELHKAYADKEVLFLYLSMDEDFEKWEKAAKEYGIDSELNSYIVYNKHTSEMLEILNVQSIPRYLLYDRQGKLVHKNAPGPGSDAIRKLLDQYLADS